MKNRIVTVGTFDGLHRGHMEVLRLIKRESEARSLSPMVVTFDRHPLEVVRPGQAPLLVMDPDVRDCSLAGLGMEVERVSFTESVRSMSCREWMEHLAREKGMKVLVLGYDNTFGRDGLELKVEDYRSIGRELGVEVLTAPVIPGCSSSAIRRALQHSELEQAADMLGRPFSIEGTVVEGRQLGRQIEVPTANLELHKRQLLPEAGVYAAEAVLPDGRRHAAVVNIGCNPTVTECGEKHVEAHLLDFAGDLYGKRLKLEFSRKLRDERRFGSLEELKRAIQEDIRTACVLQSRQA